MPAAQGRATPAMVFPNYNDHAFAKITLDADFRSSSSAQVWSGSSTCCCASCSGPLVGHDARPELRASDFVRVAAGEVAVRA
ncbi:MAG: hypothetical protein U0531_10015 [Dehalococcoidia bacterium]